MISIKYEIYHNDYNRRYENKSFRDMGDFKDWMFGLMNRPYADEKMKNMWFLDGVVKGRFSLDTSSRIEVRPEWGGACYWIHCVSDNNKVVFSNGKYTNGQTYISEGFKAFLQECMDKRDGKVQEFEFGEIEGYAPPVIKSMGEQADELLAQNPDLARAVFYAVQKQYDREDIISRIEKNSDFDLNDFTDKDLDEIGERFGEAVGGDERHWQRYWEIADECIKDVLEEKEKAIFCVSKDECDRIVEDALGTIRGIGVDMGSGCYDLNSFEIDGEQLNLYMDICKVEDGDGLHYSVYYAVEYVDGDNLFSDWAYTEKLDVDELKRKVFDIANTDFSKDIREEMNKEPEGALEQKIQNAKDGMRDPFLESLKPSFKKEIAKPVKHNWLDR